MRSAVAMTFGHWSMERSRCGLSWTAREIATVGVGAASGRAASRGLRSVTCGCEPSVLSISDAWSPPISADRNTITLTPTATAARINAVCPLAARM